MTRFRVPQYPPADKGTLVLWGLLADAPFGGMTWQVLHHLVGLRRLGFDVWYVEDSDRHPFTLGARERTPEFGPNVEYLARQLAAVGLGDRWVFRVPTDRGRATGALDVPGLHRLYRNADAVLDLCGAQELWPHHDVIDCLVYVETDPVVSQVSVAKADPQWIDRLDRYRHHFTYASNLGSADCRIPLERYTWVPTVPPVFSDWWATDGTPTDGAALTTILQWSSVGNDVLWEDQWWRWRKDIEFTRFLKLPSSSSVPLEAAMRVGEADRASAADVAAHGWRTTPAEDLDDPYAYRRYVQESLGEFSVAKHQYVAARSGWFSDRTVCYLAAGRPVVVQDTGFRAATGLGDAGLHVFSSFEEAVSSIDAVVGHYQAEAEAATTIAHEIFEAERVLGSMMTTVGLL